MARTHSSDLWQACYSCPPASKLFALGCGHRPSGKTAIHGSKVHPFSHFHWQLSSGDWSQVRWLLSWELTYALETNIEDSRWFCISSLEGIFLEEPLIKIKINEMLVGRQWSRKTNSARFGCFGGLSPAACFLWMSLVGAVISGENSCLICVVGVRDLQTRQIFQLCSQLLAVEGSGHCWKFWKRR